MGFCTVAYSRRQTVVFSSLEEILKGISQCDIIYLQKRSVLDVIIRLALSFLEIGIECGFRLIGQSAVAENGAGADSGIGCYTVVVIVPYAGASVKTEVPVLI